MIRKLKNFKEANHCSAPGCNELASHGVTDSREINPGVWEETAYRYGCLKPEHRVSSMVYAIGKEPVTFEEYQRVNACQ